MKLYLIFFFLLFFIIPSSIFADEFSTDEYYDAPGFNPNRDTFSIVPYEHIDTFTGNVILNFIDARLPGNGGLDLVIQRTFNSKLACILWVGTYEGWYCAQVVENSWVGNGWILHFGRIIDPYNKNPEIEMPDGSRHKLYSSILNPGKKITRDYWLYEYSYPHHILTFPDGKKIYFDHIGSTY